MIEDAGAPPEMRKRVANPGGVATTYTVKLPVEPSCNDSLRVPAEYAPGVQIEQTEDGQYWAVTSIQAADAQGAFDQAKENLENLLTVMSIRGLGFTRIRDDSRASITAEVATLQPGELPRMEVVGGSCNPVVLAEQARRAAEKPDCPAIKVVRISARLGLLGAPDELLGTAAERYRELPERLRQALLLFHQGKTARDSAVSFVLFYAALESLASGDTANALGWDIPEAARREQLLNSIRSVLVEAGLREPLRERVIDHISNTRAISQTDEFTDYLSRVGVVVPRSEIQKCRTYRGRIAHGHSTELGSDFHGLRSKLEIALRHALCRELSQRLGITDSRESR